MWHTSGLCTQEQPRDAVRKQQLLTGRPHSPLLLVQYNFKSAGKCMPVMRVGVLLDLHTNDTMGSDRKRDRKHATAVQTSVHVCLYFAIVPHLQQPVV